MSNDVVATFRGGFTGWIEAPDFNEWGAIRDIRIQAYSVYIEAVIEVVEDLVIRTYTKQQLIRQAWRDDSVIHNGVVLNVDRSYLVVILDVGPYWSYLISLPNDPAGRDTIFVVEVMVEFNNAIIAIAVFSRRNIVIRGGRNCQNRCWQEQI